MSGCKIIRIKRVQIWAQHAALWGASAECEGGGEVGAKLDRLRAVCEKVHNPGTEVSREAQVEQYGWDNSVKSRTIIEKKHPDVGLSVFKVL